MARIKIDMPSAFSFSTEMTVRIRDVNYGGHLDNAALLSLMHEARTRYLHSLGCTELDAFGTSLIMTDAAIVYKGEGFHGDRLTIRMQAGDISSRGFTLYYRITCIRNNHEVPIADAQTGMLSYNYDTRKVSFMPDVFKEKLAEGK